MGCSLGDVAIWSFHGTSDGTVPFGPDEQTMNLLMACPSPPRRDARFTQIDGGSHFIWPQVYDNSYGNVYGWLLANPLP